MPKTLPDPSDAIKKKIVKLYENYGIEIDFNYEDGMDAIVEFYLNNPDKLDKDIGASSKSKELLKDEDVL